MLKNKIKNSILLKGGEVIESLSLTIPDFNVSSLFYMIGMVS